MTIVTPEPRLVSLEHAVMRIAQRGADYDRSPRFPHENWSDLQAAGALDLAPHSAQTLTQQIALVSRIAAADASTARILDGHLNGVERLLTATPGEVPAHELERAAGGRLLLGVWGADPQDDEGDPARIVHVPGGSLVLRGVKVFCSGAGGVQRALVVASDAGGARRLAYVDTTTAIHIDYGWYQASGLRSSESHRVTFTDATVLAILGGPDELSRQPYFARDGVRTVAIWAGLSHAIAAATLTAIAQGEGDSHQDAALGRIRVHLRTIDLWLAYAARSLDQPAPHDAPSCSEIALGARVAVAESSRAISAAATQICGSRATVTLADLDRARRDLEIFLLQHRLERQLEGLGRRARGAQR
jgi:alkylation response protein AidB-like acyl-CoA dehydrogenase